MPRFARFLAAFLCFRAEQQLKSNVFFVNRAQIAVLVQFKWILLQYLSLGGPHYTSTMHTDTNTDACISLTFRASNIPLTVTKSDDVDEQVSSERKKIAQRNFVDEKWCTNVMECREAVVLSWLF